MSATRILLAVSSPWASEKFMEPIADLACRLDAEVVVAHVAQQKHEDEEESDARQRGEETLRLLTEHLGERSIRTESVLLFSNDIARAILSTAKARSCTLIALGHNANRGLGRLIWRNVPEAVLKHAEVPVIVCPTVWVGTF